MKINLLLLEQYKQAENELINWRIKTFPVGSTVSINSPQYKGTGRVVPSGTCPIDKLSVMLENNNIWWYPIEMCSPATY